MDAVLLLARVLGRGREWLVAHGDAAVADKQVREFTALCRRRATGIPIAYLLGAAGFYGRRFVVTQSVLVPRPETEHLVDEAVHFVRERRNEFPKRALTVLDVGTGCGAIACTIAAETSAVVDATDASRRAIDLAAQNARRLGVQDRCRFHYGDLAEPVCGNRFDVVIANLPYVPTSDLPQPPDSASFEPRDALDGGPDGLALYRRLLPELPKMLQAGGLVVLEAAPPTIHELAGLVRLSFPEFVIEERDDYAGLARYVKAVPKERPAEPR